jgi:hypothetical protein
MKNAEDVSLPPAQSAGWGLKSAGDEANVTEKLILELRNGLQNHGIGGKSRKRPRKLDLKP